MLSKFNKKKIAGVTLAGVIMITGAAAGFAANQADNKQRPTDRGRMARMNPSEMSEIWKSALDKLVAAGTITQEQEDAVLKVFSPKEDGTGKPERDGKGPMDSLVSEGTITQEQAEAISEAMKAARDSGKKMEDVLAELVSAGTITEAQKEAILEKMPFKGEFKGEHKSPLDKLVSEGTITQEQADAIQKAVKAAMDSAKTSSED